MKEAYSAHLLDRVLRDTGLLKKRRIVVGDPYAGSGTTAVSLGSIVRDGRTEHARFFGIEANPFLHLAASAKLGALETRPTGFLRFAGAAAAAALRKNAARATPPGLSTFHRTEFFSTEQLDELLRLRAAIETAIPARGDLIHDLLRLCLAASVEPASYLRRDGRALRHEPGKQTRKPIDEFLALAATVEDDISATTANVTGDVVLGDARSWAAYAEAPQCDLAVFSPPYPNNIDYTEVYKLEAWILNFINSSEEFANQRHKTVRSHPSLRFAEEYSFQCSADASAIEELVRPLLNAVPSGDRYSPARRRLILGYVDDMYATLCNLRRVLKPEAPLVYVVGNSMHGSTRAAAHFVIAADLLIARLAELTGFEVTAIGIARRPTRRSRESKYLRESVVFAQVPARRDAK
jgi:DNA modification methylase